MATFQIQDIVERAASQADMEGNFVEPEEWLRWYRPEARSLDLFLLRSGYTQSRPVTATANPAANYEITTGDGMLAVLGVFEVRDNKFRPLVYQTPAEFYDFDPASPAGRDTGDAKYFTVERGAGDINVVLKPLPTSGTYKALFYPDSGSTGLTALTDPVDWPLGFEERIVLSLAIRALTKEDSDTSAVERLLNKEESRIENVCFGMNYGDGARIRNVDGRDRGWKSTMVYGPWESWIWL